MKKIFLLLVVLLFKSYGFAQEKISKYKIILNWQQTDNSINYLSVNTYKGLRVIDSAVIDKITKISKFEIDATKIPKGIYTIINKDKNNDHTKDIFLNVVLDKDSVIIFNIVANSNIQVVESQDNRIFFNFLSETEHVYNKLNFITQLIDKLNKQKDTIKSKPYVDSFLIAQQQLDAIINKHKKTYPNHIVNILFTIQQTQDMLQNNTSIPYEDKKKLFWDAMPLKDERILRTSNFYDVFRFYINYYVNNNTDTLINALIKVGHNLDTKNYVEYTQFLTDNFCLGKSVFKDAESVCVAINEQLIKPKSQMFEKRFVTFVEDKCLSFKISKIGNTAANFELLDINGKRKSLRDIKSENILIVFWDPHCWHCKQQVPMIDSIIKNDPIIRNKPLVVVGIKTDGPKEDWLEFIKKNNLTTKWIHLEDTRELRTELNKNKQLNFRTNYGVDQTPLLFLLDRNQKIIAKYFKPLELKNYLK